MDDQSSPSNPKPPTQTTIANRNSEESVNIPKSCEFILSHMCLHEDRSSVNSRLTSGVIPQQKTKSKFSTAAESAQ